MQSILSLCCGGDLPVLAAGPPPHNVVLGGLATLPALGAQVPHLLVQLDHDDQHPLRQSIIAGPALDIRPDRDRVLDIQHLIPHRPCKRPVRWQSHAVTFWHGALRSHEPLTLDRHAAEISNNPKPESGGEPG